MNKKILIFFIIIISCGYIKATNTIDVSDTTDNTYKIQVNISLNQFHEKEILINQTLYQILTMPEYGYSNEIGKPELPAIRFLLAVPSLSNISLRTLEANYSILPEDYNIYPVQEPVPMNETPEFTINQTFYSIDSFYPVNLVNISGRDILRDYNIIQLEIFPFQYNPVTKKVKFYSNLIFELEFKEKPSKFRETPLFDDFYRAVIKNYDSVKDWPARVETREVISNSMVGDSWYNASNGADYLIITYDSFYNNIIPLANWKEEKGLKTEVVKKSEINDSNNNNNIEANEIYDFINYTYHYWSLAPTYVLLVGDVEYIPTYYYRVWHGQQIFIDAPTDHNYSDLDYLSNHNESYFSEVFVGRISIKNTTELDVVVNKTVDYEKTSYLYETDWYKKATMWFWSNVSETVNASTYSRDLLVTNNYTHIDMFNASSSAPPPYTTSDVTNAINDGRAFVTYMGHGQYNEWKNVPFSIPNVLSLSNGRKLPLIITTACSSGKFDSDSIGEAWVKGNISKFPEVNGGLGYFGPSESSSYPYATFIMEGVYTGIFNHSLFSFAEATNYAKIYMYNKEGSGEMTQRHFYLFNNLGDPELKVLPEFILPLTEGWNLISIPIEPINASRDAIFPSDKVQAVWEYDTQTGYSVPTEIHPKKGYWVKAKKIFKIIIAGTRPENKTVELKQGWNLIGVIGKNTTENWQPYPDDPQVQATWQYNNPGGYEVPTNFFDGKGFWIKANATTTIWEPGESTGQIPSINITWSIKIKSNNVSYITLTYGMEDNATDDFDDGIDYEVSPAGPNEEQAKLVIVNYSLYSDKRAINDSTWKLQVSVPAGENWSIEFSQAGLEESFNYTWQEANSSWDGTGEIHDLLTDNVTYINNTGIDKVDKYYLVKVEVVPEINLNLIYPTTDINVTRNQFFNVTVNVSCLNANCGEINVSLDPELATKTYTIELSQADRDFWNNVVITRNDDIFNISYEDKGILFRPFFVGDGINNTWQEIKADYPELNISFYEERRGYDYKYGFKINNPNNITFDYIDIKLDSLTSLTLNDIRKEDERIIIKDKIVLDFSDIKTQDYSLSLPEKTIARITGNFNGLINIDPTISYLPNLAGGAGWREAQAGSSALWTWNDCDSTVYSASELNTISVDDANSVQISLATGTQAYRACHRIRFNISENIPDITNISVLAKHKYTGIAPSSPQIALYIGNVSGASWTQLATSTTTGSIVTQSGNITGSISQFINNTVSGKFIYVLLFTKSSYDQMITHDNYYLTLNVTYTTTKTGLISTTIGAEPFYTNVSNPFNLTLNKDESQIVTFWVNATGSPSTHTFFVYANKTSEMSILNMTSKFNVTIMS